METLLNSLKKVGMSGYLRVRAEKRPPLWAAESQDLESPTLPQILPDIAVCSQVKKVGPTSRNGTFISSPGFA